MLLGRCIKAEGAAEVALVTAAGAVVLTIASASLTRPCDVVSTTEIALAIAGGGAGAAGAAAETRVAATIAIAVTMLTPSRVFTIRQIGRPRPPTTVTQSPEKPFPIADARYRVQAMSIDVYNS